MALGTLLRFFYSAHIYSKLYHLGYLEVGLDAVVATAYDPLLNHEPALARTMAASVQQRIAFGEQAGQKVRPWPFGV